jgi:hypothetical protein
MGRDACTISSRDIAGDLIANSFSARSFMKYGSSSFAYCLDRHQNQTHSRMKHSVSKKAKGECIRMSYPSSFRS